MKKIILALAALGASIGTASAQVELGVKISPSITSLRTDAPDHNFASQSSKFSFGGGLILDYFFGENYAFGTGLFLTGKGGTIAYDDNNSLYGTTRMEQKVAIQYVELPATIKLFTNEIAPDIRLYFQLGASLAVPISTRINGDKYYTDKYLTPDPQTAAGDHVFAIDANGLLALGTEYQLGKSTKVLAGLSYHRGLIDLDRYFEKTRGFKDVAIKNDVFALDLGMKF